MGSESALDCSPELLPLPQKQGIGAASRPFSVSGFVGKACPSRRTPVPGRLALLLMFSLLLAGSGAEICCDGDCGEGPVLTACGTYGGSCTFDLVPQVSSSLSDYRRTVAWPKLELTWTLARPWEDLDQDDQQDVIQAAFDAWAEQCPLTFTYVDSGADISISFEDGDLGDGTRFDQFTGDDRNEMARAFFPGTTRQGIIQLDATETWSVEPRNDQPHLYSILVHEIGHVIGLEHVSHPSAAMAADYTGPVLGLTAADIQAVQRLYGSADGTVPPTLMPRPGELPDPPPTLVGDVDIDSDGDGLPDRMEVLVLDTDPDDADSDGDGVDDYTEVFQLGTPAAAERLVAKAHAVYPALEAGWPGKLSAWQSYDPSGWPIQYRWQQVDGPETPLAASNTMEPSFTAPMVTVEAVVTFELTVTNSRGTRPVTDRVSVRILPRYSSGDDPVASAGSDAITYEGRQVKLDARGSYDPGGLGLSFEWLQTGGPTASLSDETSDSPTFVAPDLTTTTPSIMTFRVTVTNGSTTASDTVNITVRALNGDSDGDGLTNGDEIDFYGTDPDDVDSDDDGFPDGADAYPRNSMFQ